MTIVGFGSSITKNGGGCSGALGGASQCCGAPPCTSRWNVASHGHGFLRVLFDWINATYPHPRHAVYNAGQPGSTPSTFLDCVNSWLPPQGVDLIVFEFVVVTGAQDYSDAATAASYARDLAAVVAAIAAPNFFTAISCSPAPAYRWPSANSSAPMRVGDFSVLR